MTTPGIANEWDLTVPADDSQLVAELRRHGVRVGQTLHVAVVSDDIREPEPIEPLPSFFGSFDGPADLAERSSDILQSEFPTRR